ncbi:MAG: DUF4838 domain-containing protein [Bacilli bacterium]|jgi:hypothetical protein
MKKVYKVSIIVISSLLISGCKLKPVDDRSSVSIDDVYQEIVLADTDIVLAQDHTSDYVVIYPEGADNNILNAVAEMVEFFFEATGYTLPTYTDTAYQNEAVSAPFISIGETSHYAVKPFEYHASEIGSSGYIIKLDGANVFIKGGYFGNLYGTYEFLHHQFGLEFYAEEEIYLEQVDHIAYLKDFDLKDIPSFDYRIGGNGEISGYAGGKYMNRMRMMSFGNVYVGSWHGDHAIPPFHNTMDYIPPSEFAAEHPNWFSPDGHQLCLTRDPEGLMNAVVPRVIHELELYPERNIVTFTQMDGPTWCTCDNCKFKGIGTDEEGDTVSYTDASLAEREYYSRQNLRFVNELAKRIAATYTQANGYQHGREVFVYLFSYGMTSAAPIKYNADGTPVLDEQGNYVIYDQNLEIADNLGVLFCYAFSTTYTGEYNNLTLQTIDRIKRWSAITNHFSFWAYSTHFTDYFVPYDSQQQLLDTIKVAYEAGGQCYYNMAQYDMKTPVDWGRLESYLQSKLSWNHHLNEQKLIDDFFDNYFKDASATMKELYYLYKCKMADLATNYNVGHTINTATAVLSDKYWTYGELNHFLSYIDRAYEAIFHYESTDSALYLKLRDRINLESMTFRYLLYKLHPSMFDYDVLMKLQTQLIDEARNLGVAYAKEHYDISSLF